MTIQRITPIWRKFNSFAADSVHSSKADFQGQNPRSKSKVVDICENLILVPIESRDSTHLNLHSYFDDVFQFKKKNYVVGLKLTMKISSIFVAFLENTNFKNDNFFRPKWFN